MYTRSNKQLFNNGAGATGTEAMFSDDGTDVTPADPTDSKLAIHENFTDDGNDNYVVKSTPLTEAADDYWAVSGDDLILASL